MRFRDFFYGDEYQNSFFNFPSFLTKNYAIRQNAIFVRLKISNLKRI
jgi:hypothetical protein